MQKFALRSEFGLSKIHKYSYLYFHHVYRWANPTMIKFFTRCILDLWGFWFSRQVHTGVIYSFWIPIDDLSGVRSFELSVESYRHNTIQLKDNCDMARSHMFCRFWFVSMYMHTKAKWNFIIIMNFYIKNDKQFVKFIEPNDTYSHELLYTTKQRWTYLLPDQYLPCYRSQAFF